MKVSSLAVFGFFDSRKGSIEGTVLESSRRMHHPFTYTGSLQNFACCETVFQGLASWMDKNFWLVSYDCCFDPGRRRNNLRIWRLLCQHLVHVDAEEWPEDLGVLDQQVREPRERLRRKLSLRRAEKRLIESHFYWTHTTGLINGHSGSLFYTACVSNTLVVRPRTSPRYSLRWRDIISKNHIETE